MSLPQKLKQLRAQYNMTQDDLAKEINVARTTIAGYETRNRQPSYEKLCALADVFNVTVDYLLEDKEEAPPLVIDQTPDPNLDQQFLSIYNNLNSRSKEDAYEYLRLLALREKYQP